MHGSDVTVTLPNPLSVLFLGWLALGESGWFGDRNLSALGTHVFTSCPPTALWSPWAHRSPA